MFSICAIATVVASYSFFMYGLALARIELGTHSEDSRTLVGE
ncbi:MAG: hypothetical protein AB4050_14780 [Synechococcus sp.]